MREHICMSLQEYTDCVCVTCTHRETHTHTHTHTRRHTQTHTQTHTHTHTLTQTHKHTHTHRSIHKHRHLYIILCVYYTQTESQLIQKQQRWLKVLNPILCVCVYVCVCVCVALWVNRESEALLEVPTHTLSYAACGEKTNSVSHSEVSALQTSNHNSFSHVWRMYRRAWTSSK